MMQRLPKITVDSAQGKAKVLLEGTRKAMGAELNIFSTFANAPAALEGYLGLMGALGKGALNPKLREQLALVTAGSNGCNYCASAHTYLGDRAGITQDELAANLGGHSAEKRTQAALTFALRLIERRGRVTEAEVQAVRDAGFSNEEVVEILAHVAMNIFTNYFNEAFQVEIDFPLVNTEKTRAAV